MKYFLLLIAVIFFEKSFSQKSIDTTTVFQIGGINQIVSIKGKDDSKSLLLFLHGGPGGSVMKYADKFTTKLQQHFIVVQWDQRETGQTLKLNSSPAPLTLKLFEEDTHELIQVLLSKFHKKKLYLVGHSWGTALGFYIADQYPDLLYAYVAISPMISQLESERIAVKKMIEKAESKGDKIEVEELSKIKIPFENGEQLYLSRKGLLKFNGHKNTISREYVLTWSQTWLRLFNEASEIDLLKSMPEINCPVYFFVGSKDYQTNAWITETFYTQLIAEKKKFYWFKKSGHFIPSSEPILMQDIIINEILPETL